MLRTTGGQIAKRAILLFTVWLVLTAADPDALPLGLIAVAAATWLSHALRPDGATPVRPLRAFALVPGFLWQSFLGGLDVARRAFDPAMPLAPGWFVIPARLPEGGPRVMLGGEFSLLPGTLVAGTRGDSFLVHVLDRNRDVVQDFEAGEAALRRAIDEARP
ncbi:MULTISPECIES: Na+/H+ antiporter subunit E [unclassified Roseitalea]|uniref:Na+/H+ antiporter subunit E n=1 Tax=unclassified Roseitalea TaxID=2639107 RepID=UPI00273F67E1|nr:MULTISPECIES: Na+/H+ antiporter subunit E [unclassified Roseitalea]